MSSSQTCCLKKYTETSMSVWLLSELKLKSTTKILSNSSSIQYSQEYDCSRLQPIIITFSIYVGYEPIKETADTFTHSHVVVPLRSFSLHTHWNPTHNIIWLNDSVSSIFMTVAHCNTLTLVFPILCRLLYFLIGKHSIHLVYFIFLNFENLTN